MSAVARPPATDLVAVLEYLMDKVEALETARDEERISATEAGRRFGFSEGYCRGKPWRVPGFGAAGTRHPVGVWRAWLDRPERERHLEWDSMSLAERQRILGIEEDRT